MNLTEAANLAALIHSDDRFVVIAIGRFLMIEELSRPGAIEHPWGLTVMPRDNPQRRVTLWGPEQWTEYRDLVLEELAIAAGGARAIATAQILGVGQPSQAVQDTADGPPVIKVTPTEDQLLLF